jgi:hypothetical protein
MTDGSPLDASQRLPKTGTVRSRASPPSKAGEQNAEGRPPTKRARKAINCEPCRNSKLKCDRFVLCKLRLLLVYFNCSMAQEPTVQFVRSPWYVVCLSLSHPLFFILWTIGTSALCYQDGRVHEGESMVRRDDIRHVAVSYFVFVSQFVVLLLTELLFCLSRTSIDPAQEIARLRHSISLLEAHIFPNQRSNSLTQSGLATTFPKTEVADSGFIEKDTAPGMLGSPGQGGLYAGPTSAATHLLLV